MLGECQPLHIQQPGVLVKVQLSTFNTLGVRVNVRLSTINTLGGWASVHLSA